MSVSFSQPELRATPLHGSREPEQKALQQARVGIVTPCYNAEAFVEDTIASVDAQTFSEWTHLLVNDGSTDDTGAILDGYADQDPRRRIMHQSNHGHALTRNRVSALLEGKVDYLLFLDADDVLESDALQTAVRYLDRHSEVAAVHWRFEVVDGAGVRLPTHFKNEWHRRHVPTRFGVEVLPDEAADTPLEAVITHCGMIPSCMLMRASAFLATGGFNELGEEAGLADVDLFIQLALQAPIQRIPETLTQYRVHDDQITADIPHMDRQYEKLLRRWRGIARRNGRNESLEQALLFAECRKPLSDRLYAAASEWRQGAYSVAARIWGAAVARYLWSLLPSRLAAPLYLRGRSWVE